MNVSIGGVKMPVADTQQVCSNVGEVFRANIQLDTDGVLAIHLDKQQSVSTGNLTGTNLRAIAALDQLQALLDDRLFKIVEQIAESDQEGIRLIGDIVSQLLDSSVNGFDAEEYIEAIIAMALFCLAEIKERRLK